MATGGSYFAPHGHPPNQPGGPVSSPLEEPGIYDQTHFRGAMPWDHGGFDHWPVRHDRFLDPCPHQPPHSNPNMACSCNCFSCAHRWRLGSLLQQVCYQDLFQDGHTINPTFATLPIQPHNFWRDPTLPAIRDPPRRLFMPRPLNLDQNLQQLLPRSPRWGTMLRPWGPNDQTRLPVELMNLICAFAAELPDDDGAIRRTGVTQIPGNTEAHDNLTLAVGQWPCTEQYEPGRSFGGPLYGLNERCCPNDRRGFYRPYRGRISICQEPFCIQNSTAPSGPFAHLAPRIVGDYFDRRTRGSDAYGKRTPILRVAFY